jgi:AcrR family transcriptional regulator
MGRRKAFDERDVLEKALELFWELGYAATSLDMLTTKMGIARPSLYNCFGSKSHLFLRCFRHYEKTGGSFIWKTLGYGRIEECVRLMANRVVDAASDEFRPKGFFLSLCMTEAYCHCPEIMTFVRTRRMFYEQMIARRFMQDSRWKNDPKGAYLLAETLIMITDGLSVAARIGHPRAVLRKRCDAALATLLPAINA